MSSTTNVLGTVITGISSDSWHSIQAFATDYYLGLNASSNPPTVAQLSDVNGQTLWQIIAAGPDTSLGVYALRSKSANGEFCLYGAPPQAQRCANDAGQYQLYNGTSDGVIFVSYQTGGRSALSVDDSSSKGAAVGASEFPASGSSEGNSLWGIRDEDEAVDSTAYSLSFTPSYAVSGSSSSGTVASVPTNSSLATTSMQAIATVTSTAILSTGTAAVPTTTAAPSTSAGDRRASATSAAPTQQTGAAGRVAGMSVKSILAGAAVFSLLGMSL